MISVCMPTFNGAAYISEQIKSILSSPLVSELIISDDGSTDGTIDIVKNFYDSRIKIFNGPSLGLIKNIEFLLSLASKEYIFLADQDDIWFPKKVSVMLKSLRDTDMVVCNCIVVNSDLGIVHSSFFALRNSGRGLFKNLLRNSYLGCCIAFRRKLLAHGLPFPDNLPMHDWWLGLIAESFGKTVFIDEPLMMYRRHGQNVSSTSERSHAPWSAKFFWRIHLVFWLVFRKLSFANFKSDCS